MMLFFNDAEPKGAIKAEEFVALGKKHNVPTFNDAAADVPPTENLSRYTKMGFDLVTFSGGKGLRGPQSAGLLLGRKDLIEAARMNSSPNGDTIGRGLKVNKEEMLGMLVAVETFVKRDAEAEWREWERRAKLIIDAATSQKGIQAETYVPPIANHVPHVRITWSKPELKLAANDVRRALRRGRSGHRDRARRRARPGRQAGTLRRRVAAAEGRGGNRRTAPATSTRSGRGLGLRA